MHTNRLCGLIAHPITDPGSWLCILRLLATARRLDAHIFASIRELRSAQCHHGQSRALREIPLSKKQKEPPRIRGTKAGIIWGEIQEQCTILNGTISSTSARYSNISYYTWHNKSILFTLCYVPTVRKRLCETTKAAKNGREVQREGEWTGNRERNGVFLWADFKWQCNRCPTKGWPSLIRLDFGDKSALLLTMSKSLRLPIFFLMSGWCGRMG